MHLFNACGQFESMAASVPETSPTGTPPRRRWHLHRIVIVSGLIVLVVGMIRVPLANAGSPDEPAPPTAIM